ncbi:MAG TPA: hypothetical protein VGC79_02605, partial [Polyangiaceae bacterium]
ASPCVNTFATVVNGTCGGLMFSHVPVVTAGALSGRVVFFKHTGVAPLHAGPRPTEPADEPTGEPPEEEPPEELRPAAAFVLEPEAPATPLSDPAEAGEPGVPAAASAGAFASFAPPPHPIAANATNAFSLLSQCISVFPLQSSSAATSQDAGADGSAPRAGW